MRALRGGFANRSWGRPMSSESEEEGSQVSHLPKAKVFTYIVRILLVASDRSVRSDALCSL